MRIQSSAPVHPIHALPIKPIALARHIAESSTARRRLMFNAADMQALLRENIENFLSSGAMGAKFDEMALRNEGVLNNANFQALRILEVALEFSISQKKRMTVENTREFATALGAMRCSAEELRARVIANYAQFMIDNREKIKSAVTFSA